jgi:hypothetical protein
LVVVLSRETRMLVAGFTYSFLLEIFFHPIEKAFVAGTWLWFEIIGIL